MDDKRPEVSMENMELNAYILRSKFKKALVLKKWQEAKEALDTLMKEHFTSDTNALFLRIQLLSYQDKWKEIWNDPDYRLITGLDMVPTEIAKIMLTAFYKNVIEALENRAFKSRGHNIEEQDIAEILKAFNDEKDKLGTLLHYRSDLISNSDVLLRVFSYYFSLEKNAEMLSKIKKLSSTKEGKLFIDKLSKVTGLDKKLIDERKEEECDHEGEHLKVAREYYNQREYELCYYQLLECEETSVERIKLLLGCAYVLKDTDQSIVGEARMKYKELSQENKELILSNPSTAGWVELMIGKEEEPKPENWAEWFEALLNENFDVNKLQNCLYEKFDQYNNVNLSSIIHSLTDTFGEIITSQINNTKTNLLKLAMESFPGYVVGDKNFPDPLAMDLYNYISYIFNKKYVSINEGNTNILLKFAETLVERDISFCKEQWQNVKRWFNDLNNPNMKFAPYLLDTLEYFAESGIKKDNMVDLWNQWIATLLEDFTIDKKTEIISWINLGNLLCGNQNLIDSLEEILEEPTEVDYIAELGTKKVAIFTLKEKPAKRAANMIKERNENLDIRICTDAHFSERSKQYATNSDIVVIVTTHMAHALTVGVMDTLKTNPLYPRSSGQTAIIEVLEEYS
ncbi:MAG: hypothetical protein ACOCRO_08580, partial [Halanaerobiales bacterium]